MIESVIDKSLVATLPRDIEPNMKNAWRVFRYLTPNVEVAKREQAWFDLVKSVAPDLDQIDFTKAHWQEIIKRLIVNNGALGDRALPLGSAGTPCTPTTTNN